jgi:hypothetical protein
MAASERRKDYKALFDEIFGKIARFAPPVVVPVIIDNDLFIFVLLAVFKIKLAL